MHFETAVDARYRAMDLFAMITNAVFKSIHISVIALSDRFHSLRTTNRLNSESSVKVVNLSDSNSSFHIAHLLLRFSLMMVDILLYFDLVVRYMHFIVISLLRFSILLQLCLYLLQY